MCFRDPKLETWYLTYRESLFFGHIARETSTLQEFQKQAFLRPNEREPQAASFFFLGQLGFYRPVSPETR